jgi:hypothetical protein
MDNELESTRNKAVLTQFKAITRNLLTGLGKKSADSKTEPRFKPGFSEYEAVPTIPLQHCPLL